MRKLAARIGYTPTVIYAHFQDKENLLAALVEADFDSLEMRMEKYASVHNPVNRLRYIAQEFVKFALENPNQYSIIADLKRSAFVPTPVAGTTKPYLSAAESHTFLARTVNEAIQSKLLGHHLSDAELIAQTFFAGIHGVIATYLGHGRQEKPGVTPVLVRVNLMIDLLLHGLGYSEERAALEIS